MSQNQWNIGVNAYIWQRSIDYSINNAQEGDAAKKINLKIWMHLLQKKFTWLHLIWARISYFYRYTKIPTSTDTQKFDAASFAQIWAKMKIPDFVITHLQRDEGKIRSW